MKLGQGALVITNGQIVDGTGTAAIPSGALLVKDGRIAYVGPAAGMPPVPPGTPSIDAKGGTLTNVIDFEKGKLTGLRVVVDGEPTSNTDIGLTFRSVSILRKLRFPRLFGEVNIRLPSRLIRWFASRNGVEEERGMEPYLRLRYVDDTLRMHTTDSGNWFIQTRI